MKIPTDKEIYRFCKNHYYTDEDTLWQPFEDEDKAKIEEYIKDDVIALKNFLKI